MKKPEIKNHILMPKHTKLSEKEKQDLLKKYNITAEQLPSILKTDAAISSINAKPSDIIKIERKSPTSGTSLFYRVIISG